MTQKLTFLLRRRPELSRAEFQQTWREQHAPLVAERAERIACVRYVQVHSDLDAEARPERPEPFDGVAELWFDAARGGGTPEQRAQAGRDLLEDERRFIDLERSPIWMSEERPVIELGSGPRRLTYVLTRKPDLTRPAFQKYWWEQHGPLVRSHAPPRLRRYVQVHTLLDAEDFAARRVRNAPAPYDGLALLWYDEAFPGRTAEADAVARPLIQDDEAKFIDWSRSPLWMGVEHVIVER